MTNRRPIPRLPFLGGTVTFKASHATSPVVPVKSRSYNDSRGTIEVSWSPVHVDAETIPYSYSYGGHPLAESWPTAATPTPYDTPTSEMCAATRALAGMGISDVSMTRREPPEPDLFFDSEQTGAVAAEVTLNIAEDEQQFQAVMGQFLDFLNAFVDRLPSDRFPLTVNLGFINLPRPRDFERIACDIIAQVRSDESRRGRQEFTGELRDFFCQYLMGERGNNPAFAGGAVVNERGLPNIFETALARIADKRSKKYSFGERKAWLILGASRDPLFAPRDTLQDLFRYDVELGQFDAIVAVGPQAYVCFQRLLRDNYPDRSASTILAGSERFCSIGRPLPDEEVTPSFRPRLLS